MSIIKRRHFLQLTGGAIATLGLSQFDIQRQSFRYAKVLAETTPRKLALLIGINKYPNNPLYGCVTDVELQKDLLIHRFGFKPNDILIVTDAQATREGILAAFEEHLIKQAKPGDVVVYHYSGHGSRVTDPDADAEDKLNSTFVPVDSSIITTDGKNTISDIMGHTLFLLMSAVNTDNLTVVLDSCHSGGGTRGNIRVRSLPRINNIFPEIFPSAEELAYQRQWLSRLNISPEEFKQKRRELVAKGVVIASATRNQLAADSSFDGFNAGEFTYLMTQYLWQQTGTPPVVSAIANISRRTTQVREQDPEAECNPKCDLNSDTDKRPFYFLKATTPAAEAVVTEVKGKDITCWFGGIDASNPLSQDSIFAIVDNSERELAKVKIEFRQGLSGKVTFFEGNAAALKPGALLQEQVRGIPNNLALRIGLDSSLEQAFTSAQKALQNIPRLEAVPVQKGQGVEYILGRMTEADQQKIQKLVSNLPEVGSFGLFTPNKDRIIEDSFGTAQETVEAAVTRLQPKFKLLLAGKVLRATLNPNSSKLSVEAAIVPVGGRNGETLAGTATRRGSVGSGSRGGEGLVPNAIAANIREIKSGANIQIQVKNTEAQDLYVNVLAIDSEGEIRVLFPSDFKSAAEAARVASGQTLLVPRRDRDNFDFKVEGVSGTIEILIVASVAPLRDALKGLEKIATRTEHKRGESLPVDDPSEMMTGLLSDFDNSTRSTIKITRRSSSLVDTNKLAALSMMLDVVI
jgi:hypothetical protein